MEFRKAKREDLSAIVKMLADDPLGQEREKYEVPLPKAYENAFSDIEKQAGNQIILAVQEQKVIACLQLIIIPGLARLGMKRAQIEGVRVAAGYRGKNIGEALFLEAMNRAKREGCELMQLTTDKKRIQAHHFYDKLGFEATHEGMKLFIK